MQVLFQQNVAGVGRKGEVKNVKEGFYKNFLAPRKLAIIASEGKIKEAMEMRKHEVVRKDRLTEEAKEIAKRIDGTVIVIKSKAKGDKLYGSISEKDIIEALREKANVELEKDHLKMSEHIKVVGSYEIPVHIAEGADAKIVVEVKGE